MNYDLLLSWISERGEGGLTSFRRAHDWLTTDTDTDQRRWSWTLQSLQSLGHVEVDWSRRQWAAAPPTIATMVGGGGFAFLSGARTRWFLQRIENLEHDAEIGYLADSVLLEDPVPQALGPSLQLLTLSSGQDVATLCDALGVRYAPYAADTLLALLPPLSAVLQTGRRDELPGGVFPTRMGDSSPGRPLFDEVIESVDPSPGAYCVPLFDVPRFFYVHRAGDVFEAGYGDVVYAELRRQDRHVLRWSAGDSSLLVPARLRLPELYERAAVLRTGLLPILESNLQVGRALTLLYRNIDLAFARQLGEGLGQQVEVVEAGSSNTVRRLGSHSS